MYIENGTDPIRSRISLSRLPAAQGLWISTRGGGSFSTGIYLIRLQAGEFQETQKMVLVRQASCAPEMVSCGRCV